MSKTFAARLNRLFDTVYSPGRGHTSAEVIAALKAEGITMSAPYLSQLRSGNRTNPSSATMAALANFFRIKPAYFTDDEYYEKLDQELTWARRDARRGRAAHCGTHRRTVVPRRKDRRPSRRRGATPQGAARLARLGASAPSCELRRVRPPARMAAVMRSWYCRAISRVQSRSE